MTYGVFVNQVHKPVISEKKVQEMESLKEKVKHPVKERKKIPSSASYHDLYNLKGENPWNSKSQFLGSSRISAFSVNKRNTPVNKLRKHSQLAAKNLKGNRNNFRHKSTGKFTINENNENSRDEITSTNIENNLSEMPKTLYFNVDMQHKHEKPPRKLIITKKKPHIPKMNSKSHIIKHSPRRLKLHKKNKQRDGRRFQLINYRSTNEEMEKGY